MVIVINEEAYFVEWFVLWGKGGLYETIILMKIRSRERTYLNTIDNNNILVFLLAMRIGRVG